MWLDAFNRGDPQRYATFLSRKFPFRGAGLSEDLQLRERTGGFDLLRLRHVSDTQVTGWLRERDSGHLVEFELTLELYLQADSPLAARVAARPYRIAGIEMRGGSVPPLYQPLPPPFQLLPPPFQLLPPPFQLLPPPFNRCRPPSTAAAPLPTAAAALPTARSVVSATL